MILFRLERYQCPVERLLPGIERCFPVTELAYGRASRTPPDFGAIPLFISKLRSRKKDIRYRLAADASFNNKRSAAQLLTLAWIAVNVDRVIPASAKPSPVPSL